MTARRRAYDIDSVEEIDVELVHCRDLLTVVSPASLELIRHRIDRLLERRTELGQIVRRDPQVS